ncbi:MAG: peptidoglycan-binding protein [Acetobacteraceae bacterium]|nr:peptidoglycan-binding protein [Acetobacteraceae bacterium]
MVGIARGGRVGLAAMAAASLLAGCAQAPLGPSVTVLPGPGKNFGQFAAEQQDCMTYAGAQVQGQAEAANQRAFATGALTTLVGAGLGAAVGGAFGNAGQGAAIGSATGLAAGAGAGANGNAYDQAAIQQRYDNAFAQCMYAKGNTLPGFPQYAVATGAVPQASSGSTGYDPALVRSVQSELVRLDYLHDTPDGTVGPMTRSAIRSYEQSNGMAVDGAPSRRLLARLQSTPTGVATARAGSGSSAGASAGASPGASWVTPASDTPPPAAGSSWVTPSK